MDIGNAVKENVEKSVECESSSSNPASLVEMEFFIMGQAKGILHIKYPKHLVLTMA